MSKKSTNVFTNLDSTSDIVSHNLIVTPILVEEKPKINKFRCTSSEHNIKISNKGIKKIVSKVRSWSSREKHAVHEDVEIETDLSQSFKSLDIWSDSTEEISDSNLMRARDSLENLLKDEQNMPRDEFRSHSCASASETRNKNCPESPKSSPVLTDVSKPNTSGIKGPFWDPFDKQGRKNRKEYKRKKKTTTNLDQPKNEDNSMPLEGNSCLKKRTEEEKNNTENIDDMDIIEGEFPYKYKYFPKNSKSVVFTNEVFVVYFNGDDVICESKEPLKKDVEQQMRNKEMRHGHLLKTQEKI
ncbi:hypothetical protein NQ314_013039 [Rhamnusium bicolor]|uniref:Uncharacterized protein n=1 Tax=Rhamnusium bicolor TaxID=1586634 RepID=A0AAV8X895_9CUCU|nr:hypothetical protein NQ314_013039 [Rhamnusium bicolor]